MNSLARSLRSLPIVLLAMAFLVPRPSLEAAEVELHILSDHHWNSVAPAGKEVDAILGDVVLSNRFVSVVIAQPLASRHANMTVRDVAGCVLDYTPRQQANDQLSAYYPGGRKATFRDWSFHNSQGDAIDVDPSGYRSSEALEVRVYSAGDAERPQMSVTYRLAPDQPYLKVVQTFTNPTSAALTFSLEDHIRLDGGKEDQLKAPNGTHELFWIDDRYWQQAYGWQAEGRQIVSRSDARNSVLKYEQNATAQVTLEPGDSIELPLKFYVSANLCEVRCQLQRQSTEGSSTALTVYGRTEPVPGARVELSKDNEYYGTLWADGSGRVDQKLLPGNYEMTVSFLGFPLRQNWPLSVKPGLNIVDLKTELATGLLKVNVTDDNLQPLACKVELIRNDIDLDPDFGPESAANGVKNLRYLVQGREDILLPEGEYEVIISHGPEYDASFQAFQITDQSVHQLGVKLPRVMDTRGWVSAEFHSHSSPSGDNTGSQLGRVQNLVCEHLEFAPCTEHNRIDTYLPHLELLGVVDQLATCTGLELTGKPLPLNHQNAFPLIHKPRTQDGGAPLTDDSPEIQIQRLALWDQRREKLIQQNHPDFGWLFRDKNGDQEPDAGFAESFPLIDAIEVHPLVSILEANPQSLTNDRARQNRIFYWLQLLNQGYRMTGVVNTDAHYNFHGSGGFRNWIRSPTDDPAKIDPLEIVSATKQGQVVMSNGPFLQVAAKSAPRSRNSIGPGEELILSRKQAQLEISVQCPNWFTIDRVFVLLNGRPIPEYNFRISTHPELFQQGVVRFQHQFPADVPADTHLIVVAAGENSQLGPVMGPVFARHQPVAVSNPLYFDVNGDGFQFNQDDLDLDRPVKGK